MSLPNTLGAGTAAGAGGNVVDQTSTGCEATKRTPEDIIQGYIKKGAIEFKTAVDKYSRQHKDRISQMVPSSFIKVSPLNSPLKSENNLERPPSPAPGLTIPQHHQLFIPPLDPRGSEIPLQDLGCPLPDFRAPIQKEERTIA